jgi:diguanylate cyclase (GGDEF)-like protein/PAS domain S-box-containing protein
MRGQIWISIGVFTIGFLLSSWGYFHPQAPFWQYILIPILLIPTFWLLRVKSTQKTNPELEDTINLLQKSEQGYSKLIEFLPVPAVAHSFGMITYANRAALKVLGKIKIDQVIGKSIFRFIDQDYHNGVKEQLQQLRINSNHSNDFLECMIVGPGAEKMSVEASSMMIQLDDFNLVLTVFHDVSYRRKEEELVRKMAYICPLTHLSNRRHFEEILKEKIQESSRNKFSFFVLFIDLDGFKKVNDTFGHGVGDEVLRMVAQKLTQSVRSKDTVARFAGDEFVILIPEVQEEDAVAVSLRILQSMKNSMIVKGIVANVTASIGISCYPRDGENAESLIKHADEAMYEAKQNGKNNFKIYHSA